MEAEAAVLSICQSPQTARDGVGFPRHQTTVSGGCEGMCVWHALQLARATTLRGSFRLRLRRVTRWEYDNNKFTLMHCAKRAQSETGWRQVQRVGQTFGRSWAHRLVDFGRVEGLVVDSHGETSEDLIRFIRRITDRSCETRFRQMGFSSPRSVKSTVKQQIYPSLGIEKVGDMTRLHI